jgi:hypothetical protein
MTAIQSNIKGLILARGRALEWASTALFDYLAFHQPNISKYEFVEEVYISVDRSKNLKATFPGLKINMRISAQWQVYYPRLKRIQHVPG